VDGALVKPIGVSLMLPQQPEQTPATALNPTSMSGMKDPASWPALISRRTREARPRRVFSRSGPPTVSGAWAALAVFVNLSA
jgi:hypothetical protein